MPAIPPGMKPPTLRDFNRRLLRARKLVWGMQQAANHAGEELDILEAMVREMLPVPTNEARPTPTATSHGRPVRKPNRKPRTTALTLTKEARGNPDFEGLIDQLVEAGLVVRSVTV